MIWKRAKNGTNSKDGHLKRKEKKRTRKFDFFFLSSENNNWIKLFEFVEG